MQDSAKPVHMLRGWEVPDYSTSERAISKLTKELMKDCELWKKTSVGLGIFAFVLLLSVLYSVVTGYTADNPGETVIIILVDVLLFCGMAGSIRKVRYDSKLIVLIQNRDFSVLKCVVTKTENLERRIGKFGVYVRTEDGQKCSYMFKLSTVEFNSKEVEYPVWMIYQSDMDYKTLIPIV